MSVLDTTTVRTAPPVAQPAAVPRPLSPVIGRRELLLLAAGSLLLAIVTSWPLLLHMGSRIRPDLGDPIRTAWQVAWGGHALLHNPGGLWTSNAFWPNQLSFAFSDSLLGYAPAAFFGSGPVAALVRYNLLYLFAYALTFAGAYLLARELGVRRGAAVIAGVAFAFAPFRLNENGHLHVISAGGIPLSLFLLLRGYRRGSPWIVLAGWLVATWQVSLGFTLGLQLGYLLAALALVVLVLQRRRLAEAARAVGAGGLPRSLALATVAGLLCFGALSGWQGHEYLRVSDVYPTAKRTVAQVKLYSAPVEAFVSAPQANRIWGGATAGARAHLRSKNESTLFPGAVVLVLALTALLAPLYSPRLRTPYSARLRAGLLVGAIVTGILSLGINPTFGKYTYLPLFHVAPGFNAIRTPGRIATLTSLSLALLAAAGVELLLAAIVTRFAGPQARPERTRRRLPALALVPAAVAVLIAAAIVVEGTGHQGDPVVPRMPRAFAALRQPLLGLPSDPSSDRLYQYWSTAGFPRIANGNSTFDIPAQDDLRGGMNQFPDAASVHKLQALGIRTVVLDTQLAGHGITLPPIHDAIPEPPDPLAAARKSIAGLPLTRRRVGALVVYEIAPAR